MFSFKYTEYFYLINFVYDIFIRLVARYNNICEYMSGKLELSDHLKTDGCALINYKNAMLLIIYFRRRVLRAVSWIYPDVGYCQV